MYDYRQYVATSYNALESPTNRHGVGETRLQRYDRFQFYCARIPSHPNYCINRDGIVYDFNTGEEIMYDRDKDHIILDGERLDIDILLLYNFTGVLPRPIVPRDKLPISKLHIGR